MSSQVAHGLGSPLGTISHSDYILFEKAGYASFFLYLLAICTTKLTTLTLLYNLTPQRSHRRPIVITGAFILIWGIATIFANAFQCSMPHPYLYTSSTKCFSQTGFWYATGIIDILTDVVLMMLPVMVIAKLQLPLNKKAAIAFAFSFRLATIACTAFRLSQVSLALHRSQHYDPTFNNWLFTVATQLEIFAGIFATAIPHLRPFIESIQSGYLSGMIGEPAEGRTHYGSQAGTSDNTYNMRKYGKSDAKSRDGDYAAGTKNSVISYVRGGAAAKRHSRSMELPRHGQAEGFAHHGQPIGQAISTNDVRNTGRGVAGSEEIEPVSKDRRRSDSGMSDGGRSGSGGSVGSKAMIIKTTKEWSVTYQDE